MREYLRIIFPELLCILQSQNPELVYVKTKAKDKVNEFCFQNPATLLAK